MYRIVASLTVFLNRFYNVIYPLKTAYFLSLIIEANEEIARSIGT